MLHTSLAANTVHVWTLMRVSNGVDVSSQSSGSEYNPRLDSDVNIKWLLYFRPEPWPELSYTFRLWFECETGTIFPARMVGVVCRTQACSLTGLRTSLNFCLFSFGLSLGPKRVNTHDGTIYQVQGGGPILERGSILREARSMEGPNGLPWAYY